MGVCRRESSLFGRFPMKFFFFIITLFLFQSNIMCNSCHKSKRCFFVTLVWASKSQAVSVEKAVEKKHPLVVWCGCIQGIRKRNKNICVGLLIICQQCLCLLVFEFFFASQFLPKQYSPIQNFCFFLSGSKWMEPKQCPRRKGSSLQLFSTQHFFLAGRIASPPACSLRNPLLSKNPASKKS